MVLLGLPNLFQNLFLYFSPSFNILSECSVFFLVFDCFFNVFKLFMRLMSLSFIFICSFIFISSTHFMFFFLCFCSKCMCSYVQMRTYLVDAHVGLFKNTQTFVTSRFEKQLKKYAHTYIHPYIVYRSSSGALCFSLWPKMNLIVMASHYNGSPHV